MMRAESGEEIPVRRPSLRPAWGVIGFFILMLLTTVQTADARAGGGEGFDSGSDHSSSDDDSSSGDSDSERSGSGESSPLTAKEQRVILIAVGVVAGVLVGGISAIYILVSRNNRRAQLEIVSRLRQSDPGFEPGAFAQRARVGFDKIQKAWSGQDLSSVRAFISDGVYERFSLQFDEQKALDYRNPTEPSFVLLPKIVELRLDGKFDALTVRISASARDYRVRLSDGSKIDPDDSRTSRSFVEYWTYVRWTGARTKPDQLGLIEGNCPNCGAPITDASAKCPSCKAVLRSGEHDWVLAEITQAGEWELREGEANFDTKRIAAEDPDFSVQEMEDVASVLYWRRGAAMRRGNTDLLASVALPKFCLSFGNAMTGSRRQCFCECAVGSVRLVSIDRANGLSFAKLDIRWTGIPYTVEHGGALLQKAGERTGVRKSTFVLERAVGVRTDASHALSSAHCTNCGAPDTGDGKGVCAFCGAILHRQQTGWVLADVVE